MASGDGASKGGAPPIAGDRSRVPKILPMASEAWLCRRVHRQHRGARLLLRPFGGKALHIAQAAGEIVALVGKAVAFTGVFDELRCAQGFQPSVEGVGGDASHTVLQQTEGLRMAI